jgi:hypothetical protein
MRQSNQFSKYEAVDLLGEVVRSRCDGQLGLISSVEITKTVECRYHLVIDYYNKYRVRCAKDVFYRDFELEKVHLTKNPI